MTKRTSESVSRERQLLALVCKGLDDKKAGDLKVIDVRGLSSITDYIVIATGLAEPHLRAMRIEVEKVLDAAGAKIGGMDKNQQSGWLVVDAYQIMVHLFTAEARSRYGLEQLWRDGKELTLKAALGEEENPAEKPTKISAAKKKPTVKKKTGTATKTASKKAAAKTKKTGAKKKN
ncbi:MAG TPA: ribosome silencing factor [Opitutaceae bacterium]|nr:ribosome silencing factor [Opitutaceae bacterium]